MPAFFVPSLSLEHAENLYQRLVLDAGIQKHQRLFRLCWMEKKQTLDGRVGEMIMQDTVASGHRVSAIIATKEHILVYLESNLSSPIFVLPENVIYKSHFDDFPEDH